MNEKQGQSEKETLYVLQNQGLMQQIDESQARQKLIESSKLYQDIYHNDPELQVLTDDAANIPMTTLRL